MTKIIRQTIGLLGFCPSCLRWQGIFAFEDYVCATCHEDGKDGGVLKKTFISIATVILSYFGYGEYTELKETNIKLDEKLGNLESKIQSPVLGADKNKSKWELDNGLPPLSNPKYWSRDND